MTNEIWTHIESSVEPKPVEVEMKIVRHHRNIEMVERANEMGETQTIWTCEEQIQPRAEFEATEWIGKTEAVALAQAAEDNATTTAYELTLELIGGGE